MTEEGVSGFGLLDGLCPALPATGLESFWCAVAPWEIPIFGVLLVAILALVILFLLRGRNDAGNTPFLLPAHPEAQASPRPREPFPEDEFPALELESPYALATTAPSLDPSATSPASAPEAPNATGETGMVRYDQPMDGTLQLLPGRFEVLSGPGAGSEIRFVRIPGVEQEITFGRSRGPQYRHVQLESPTVSRQHARLIFRAGGWLLRNESGTNPTVHNGRSLGAAQDEVLLQDGDKIEMGEIRFLFLQEEKRDRLATRSSWYTDRGRRAVNQDAVMVRTLPDGREIAAVCDGMGSHSAGGIASHVAMDTLVASLAGGASLADAVRDANMAVHQAAQAPDKEGMGTTLVAVLRQGDTFEIANVGDSRAFRVDASGAHQLTRDHSFVAEMVTQGRMSYEEAIKSPWKNAVTRSLGAEPEVNADFFPGEVGPEPFLLILCSDGIHGVLEAGEIGQIARATPDIGDLARVLGEKALVKGGEDNVAAAVLQFGPALPNMGGSS
jgi:protein phosphatase